jgi:hypothetical protein
MKLTLKLSPRARATIVVCVVAILFVALFHASSWRDARLFKENFLAMEEEEAVEGTPPQVETFAGSAQVDINTIKSIKSDQYWMAGLKYFYSGDTSNAAKNEQSSNGEVFFTPSSNDLLCKLGSKDMATVCNPTKTRIDTVTRLDTTTLPRSTYNCSRQVDSTSKEPLDPLDCEIRVLNNMYTFVKICISVPVKLEKDDGTGAETLLLNPSDYGSQVLMLSRPVFISGPMCALTVPLNNFTEAFDSASKTPYKLRLGPVKNGSIWDTVDPGSTILGFVKNMLTASNSGLISVADADANATATQVVLPMTLYYLNYSKDLGKGLPAQSENNVITLYVSIENGSSKSGMFSSNSFSLALVNNIFTVSVGGKQYSIDAPRTGHVVVTYSTSLLIMVCMSNKRTVLRQFANMPSLKATKRDVDAAIATHPAVAAVYPYTNVCIPNFTDVAIKLGYF